MEGLEGFRERGGGGKVARKAWGWDCVLEKPCFAFYGTVVVGGIGCSLFTQEYIADVLELCADSLSLSLSLSLPAEWNLLLLLSTAPTHPA